MAKFILGRKMHMTQKFLADGTMVPVTVVEAGPCTVTQVKTIEKEGYQAAQIGFCVKRQINKPMAGHLNALGNFRYLREFLLDKMDNFARGKMFDVSSFKVGDKVKIIAVSKGRGFQGVVKRHHFRGHNTTHGTKDQVRMPGSIGAQGPQHVFKGTRMAGRMGNDQVTVANLEIIDIDLDKNLLYIKGAIPGAFNNLVEIEAKGDLVFVEKETKKEVKEEVVDTKVEEVVASEEVVQTPESPVSEEKSEATTTEEDKQVDKQ
jgi:large subunit ribosomal protein L3